MNSIIQGFFLSLMWKLFTYTVSEQRGIVLILIVFLATILLRFWPWNNSTSVTLYPAHKDSVITYKPVFKDINVSKKRGWRLKKFDPNYAKAVDFREMGFSNEFIRKWFGQKQGVGFVKSAEQFQSLQLLSETEFNKVGPFLDFSRYEIAKPRVFPERKKQKIVVDINLADSVELRKLPGIGKTLSKRVVKYRKALGGFWHVNQLKEVYGISDSLFQKLKPQLVMSKGPLLFNLNNCSKQKIKSHPYINYAQANAIVQYRKLHGEFKSIDDVQKVHLLDSSFVQKISPYLTFD